MARPSKTHSYRGYEICPVQYADKAAQGYRWYVQAIHSATGLAYDSGCCTHHYTLAAAKADIDYWVKEAETEAWRESQYRRMQAEAAAEIYE